MTRKNRKFDKKNTSPATPATPIPEIIEANNPQKGKTIDILNHASTLEKAKAYLNRIKLENDGKVPHHFINRVPTLQEFEAISQHCMGNFSEMALFLDCYRKTITDFINKEENREYYEIARQGKLSFNDFAISKLKENVAGVKVLGFDKLGHEKVYDRPPDTRAIEFLLRNNESFTEWGFQNTSKTQNTNVNIDATQLIQAQLEKMDLPELKEFTKKLMNDCDIKGLLE